MAREIRAADFGFYETIDLDYDGLPTLGKPLAEGIIPPNLEEFHGYIRFSGDPGLYKLTMLIEGDIQEGDITIDLGSQLVAIPVGGDAHFDIPLPGRQPPGTYVLKVLRGEQQLIEIGFTISN